MSNHLDQPLSSLDMAQKVAEMRNTCEDILNIAKQQGATQAEVAVSNDTGVSIQVRDGDVETLELNQDGSFGVSVYIGQRKGTSTTTDTRPESLKEAVSAAINIAKYTTDDPFSGLADTELMATQRVELDLDHPGSLSIEQMKDLALECEDAGRHQEGIHLSDGASFGAQRTARVYANSHGFVGDNISTRFSLSSVLIAKDDSGMQRDYWYSMGRKFDRLESAASIGAKAAQRVLARRNSRSCKTAKVPVLFAPEIGRSIFSHLFSAISGGSLYRKASFLLDSRGKQVLPRQVTIDERPLLSGGFASTWFDNEGVATRPRKLIDQGVVSDYILSSYSARKLGLKTTANAGGLHNVFVSHSEYGHDDLLKDMGTGLLVTELMGQGVNLVTGDYSRGAAGFWVENGEIQYPVHELTIAGNLKDMLNNIRAVGNDLDHRSSVVTGSVLIDGMTVAGNE